MDITKMKQEFMDAVTGARETTIKEAGEPRQLCNEKVFPAAVKLGYHTGTKRKDCQAGTDDKGTGRKNHE